jgi:hypothetical protein
MTDEMMNLRAFVEKAPDADILREMIGFAAERLMELEVGSKTGAGLGERATGSLSAMAIAIETGRRGPGRFALDQFRYRKTIEGAQIQHYQGELSDDACAVLRHVIIDEFGFDPGKENCREGAQTLCVKTRITRFVNTLIVFAGTA